MPAREANNIRWAITGMHKKDHPIIPASEMISLAIKRHGDKLTLGWSGGRCSTVVLHMALQIDPDIKVVYGNTGIEFPENVEYVHEVADLWGVNLHELHPETTFWKVVEEHGMPRFRRFGDDRSVKYLSRLGVSTDRRPYCCWLLKERPRYKFYKEHGTEGDITGMRAAESRARARTFNQRGILYELKSRPNIWVYHPIGLWSTKKMLDYFKKNDLPHNPVYDTHDRNGCWACTAYKGWEKTIMKYSPEMYKMLQKKRGVMLMDDYIPNQGPCEEIVLDDVPQRYENRGDLQDSSQCIRPIL